MHKKLNNITAFLLSVETLRVGPPASAVLQALRAGIERTGPEVLRNPTVQRQFEAIMAAGNADMQPNEINWDTVISNWDLLLPNKRKERCKYVRK